MTPILWLIAIAGCSALALLAYWCGNKTQPAPALIYTSRPPLTDEEFLQRCRPGTSPRIALKVRSIVAEQLGIPAERIYPEDRFYEDLGAC